MVHVNERSCAPPLMHFAASSSTHSEVHIMAAEVSCTVRRVRLAGRPKSMVSLVVGVVA